MTSGAKEGTTAQLLRLSLLSLLPIYFMSRRVPLVDAFSTGVSIPSALLHEPLRMRTGTGTATASSSGTASGTTTGPTFRMSTQTVDDDAGNNSNTNDTPASTTKVIPTGKVLQQTVLIDGPEWQSVQNQLLRFQSRHSQEQNDKNSDYFTSSVGMYTVVSGSINGARMVAMQHVPLRSFSSTGISADATAKRTNFTTSTTALDQDDTILVYTESIAYLPPKVSELDAIWTMIQSFSSVHCARPILQNIGGTQQQQPQPQPHSQQVDRMDFFLPSACRIVIVGNNPYAVQLASILHEVFQYNVTIVAATSTTTKKGNIQYLPPAIETTIETNNDDEDEDTADDSELLGFATVMDQFDVLIDTIGNELSNSIIQENLKTTHNCHIYISTISESQRIILQNGLIFGPNQSKEHIQKLITAASTSNGASSSSSNSNNNKNRPTYFPSPIGLGMTVQTILEKGITLQPQPINKNKNSNNVFVRSWSLKDFWEYTTWPRDATTSNSRFGFPSDVSAGNKKYYNGDFDDDIDNENDDDDASTMISAPPLRSTPGRDMFRTKFEPDDATESTNIGSSNRASPRNQYVIDVATVNDLQLIVQNELTCIVFVSAPFCRTCRYLKPQFVRMAREYKSSTGNQNQQHLKDHNSAVSEAIINESTTADTAAPPSLAASNKNSFLFIKAEASGQIGKDIGRALGIDTVPTFILYKNGRRYGTPITSVTRLPSKDLDDTILALQQNRTVDFSSLFPTDTSSINDNDDDDVKGSRTSKSRSKLS